MIGHELVCDRYGLWLPCHEFDGNFAGMAGIHVESDRLRFHLASRC